MNYLAQYSLSVVIPVYKSENTLVELVERLADTLKKFDKKSEIILVDDRSPDNSWEVILQLKSKYKDLLRIVRLQRNRGQHSAILAGFSIASGNVVITLDDDLQNPPEELPKLVEKLSQGYDLVIGSYTQKQHNRVRNFSGAIIDKILRHIFDLPSELQLTSFRAVKKNIIDHVNEMKNIFPYVTAMLLANTNSYSNVNVEHHERTHGSSTYTFTRNFHLATNLLFNYSTLPVLFVGILSLVAFFFSTGLGCWVIISALIQNTAVPGWASTIAILSFFNAILLLCLFIFAMYLSRINRLLIQNRASYTISDLDDA